MLSKALFALPFVAFSLIAAAPAPVTVPALPNINAPAEVAANPANRLTLELSNGGMSSASRFSSVRDFITACLSTG